MSQLLDGTLLRCIQDRAAEWRKKYERKQAPIGNSSHAAYDRGLLLEHISALELLLERSALEVKRLEAIARAGGAK